MLEQLPAEVLQLIISYLPTLSAIASLSRTTKKLHATITSDETIAFKPLVKGAFPSVPTPTAWKEVALSLTSRARAWDRRGVVVRDCCPPETLQIAGDPRQYRPSVIGYTPALDSYDDLSSGSLSQRRETVAWGAGGRIYLRTADQYTRNWRSIKFEDDDIPINDILQLKLLRPHQILSDTETVVFRRANGEIGTLATADNELGFDQDARFVDTGMPQSIAVSGASSPLLAVASPTRLQLYKVNTQDDLIKPFKSIQLDQISSSSARRGCMEFLNSTTVAIGTSYLDDTHSARRNGLISVYDITAESEETSSPTWSFVPNENGIRAKQYIHAIAPLDQICGNSGQMFLSGWNTGHARLHDTRSPHPYVSEWLDTVDNGQILSLATIGHERFLAGSDQNGCLKTFDMRMPGDFRYSYTDARPSQTRRQSPRSRQDLFARPLHDRRDFNVFLSVRQWRREALWSPLPMPKTHAGTVKYSGAVYSISVPSPTSPTVYAAISNHVLQVDFASTDDVEEGKLDPLLSSLKTEKNTHVFDIAAYERPRQGRESTDAVLLNKQAVWHELTSQPDRNEESESNGWDRRWRLGGTRRSSWSRGRGPRGGRRGSTGHR